MNKTKIQRVSELILPEHIEKWNDGDIITISAGCGAGKSYFIKNILYRYAKKNNKKILYLIHRTDCYNQFKQELEKDCKTDIIDIQLYQGIESHVNSDDIIIQSKYQYIVADEFHYFVNDSGFNNRTDISFNYILQQHNSIRIFMSATGHNTKNYLEAYMKANCRAKEWKDLKYYTYSLKPNYSHFNSLTFFNNDEDIEVLIQKILKTKKKAIVFVQSVGSAYELHLKYKKHTLFNCSKNNSTYSKYINKDKIKKMLDNQKFDEQILITTSCFDAGANIIDRDLKYIITDIIDVDSLEQCLGRKRSQGADDTVHILIKAINNQKINGYINTWKKSIEMAEYFKTHSVQELVEKYQREYDESGIIYDASKNNRNKNLCTKKINYLRLKKKKSDIELFGNMLKNKFGYCKYLATKFGFYNESEGFTYSILKSQPKGLVEYLEANVENVFLTRKDRDELITKLDIKKNGHPVKSIETLNSALEHEYKIPFCIEEFETCKRINGKKRNYKNAWRIIKVEPKDESNSESSQLEHTQ